MFRKTFLTAWILSASAISASAQLVAVPAPVRLPDQPVAVIPQTAAGVPAAAAAQPRFYTPTYYYYYYQPPYHVQQVQNVQVAVPAPVFPVQPVISNFGVTPVYYGTYINGRGEPGHVRFPYYSYRRPWYFPGQPSLRATIPGQVW